MATRTIDDEKVELRRVINPNLLGLRTESILDLEIEELFAEAKAKYLYTELKNRLSL